MLTHAEILTVWVTDQQAALAFYRDLLGFEVRDDAEFMPGARWITVAPPGAQTSFTLWPAGIMETDWGKPGGFTGVSFNTSDAQAAHDGWRGRA